MKTISRTFQVTLLAWVVVAGRARAQTDGGTPADRFVELLSTRTDLPAEAAELIRAEWKSCDDCDGEEFLTQGLAVVSEDFRDGLDAYDADKYAEAAARMGALAGGDDPFIATNAAAYEIKAMVAMDQMVEAGAKIAALTSDTERVGKYSYFGAEIGFLRGFCQLADLRYQDAANSLQTFLMNFPHAPQRLTMAAKQILLELANRSTEKMTDVVDLMQYSQRRLRNADGGEVVQSRQKRILDLLDEMIEEEEEKEKQACDNPQQSGGGQSPQPQPGGKSGQPTPSAPMEQSGLPGGDPSEGNLREMRRANPGEMWGEMPPGERQRILQALRESFPSRYRKLVEQYYEELAKKP
jgi:hypothetical protein